MKHITMLILALFLVCTRILPAGPHDDSRIVKVLSFNILHGATTRGDYDLDVIAKVIRDADPDLVALQEVDVRTNRARHYDLATELGLRVKMNPVFGKAMDYDGGEYGEAILSKSSFLEYRKVDLPFTPGHEPRAAIEVKTVLSSGDTIAFVGTHLDHLKDDHDRRTQVKKINDTFIRSDCPVILAGDFNAVPDSAPIRLLEQYWGRCYDPRHPEPTFPSDHPDRKIDYVLFAPLKRWTVIRSQVIQDSLASDHCALLVTLRLQD